MAITPLTLIAVLFTGFLTGILGAILGIGGGVLMIPCLVLVLGIPMHHAVGTSILLVVATSCAVAGVNVERGTANMRLGMTLEIATAMGAISGGLTAAFLTPRTLEGIFAVVLIPTAVLMWRGRTERHAKAQAQTEGQASVESVPLDEPLGALGARFFDGSEGRWIAYRLRNLAGAIGISFLAGNLSGLLGIGGGVFKVPALNLLCGVPIKAAAATSNFMIGVTAAASAFLYYGRGEVLPAVTAAAVLGVLPGSALGSSLNQRIRGKTVQVLFAALLLAVAVQMLYRASTPGS
jgi:uncharacterized membrane protein YfcA